MSPHEAVVALNMLPKIGPVRFRKLLERFGDAERILRASIDQILKIDGFGPETARILTEWEDRVDPASEIREASERGISIMTQCDSDYPQALRETYDPPLALYVWGKVEARDRHAIGIVGSRRATHYGTQSTKKLSYQLSHCGFTIISGMARGIDTAAHEAAIAAKGRTIAVIGSGLAKLYPPENLPLAEKIASGHGAVISEFPLHKAPDKQTFPMRNRIVAAWSNAILVTECPAWSGSLITANLASDYGKPIFAVPGPIDKPTSAGCHQLIRDGATLVTDASHVMDDIGELPFATPPPTSNSPTIPSELPAEEAQVLATLSSQEATIDEIIEASHLSPQVVSSTLTKLEVRQLVRSFPGSRYSKR